MSKIIICLRRQEKQIKRSIPMVLILVLVSSLVTGFAFNLDVRLTGLSKELGSKIKIGFNLPTVNADTATTSVTVKNAAPSFSVAPAESPASASTSPVNEGGSIGFNGTATDPESNSYYLIVCSSNSVTASTTGGAPTCGATQFCVSGLTAPTVEASCTHSSVSAGIGENPAWYAFACDNHATEATCSSVSSGSGDSGSPFYVNHKPVLNSASTTVNFKDPGQQVTLTGTSTDTDAQGGYDELYISFCSTNSWATSTGCTATTLCTATTTSTGSAVSGSCNYTLPSPLADQAYTYYAFVKDWHILAATAGTSANYTVNNVSPSIGTVTLNGGEVLTTNLKGGANPLASTSVQVTDNNGCADITGATSTIYLATVSGGFGCTADNNYCYQITAPSCTKTPGCVGAIADFVCTTTIAYVAHPSDNTANNSASTTDWLGAIRAYDDNGLATSSISVTGEELISLTALDVTETSIAYGNIASGQNSGTTNATTTVVNFGNTPLDANVQGTDMTKGGDTILVTEQKWNLTNFDYSGGGTTLQLTDTLAPVNIAKPSGADLSSPVYWGINIPGGKPSGNYGGTNTFSAWLYSGLSW